MLEQLVGTPNEIEDSEYEKRYLQVSTLGKCYYPLILMIHTSAKDG